MIMQIWQSVNSASFRQLLAKCQFKAVTNLYSLYKINFNDTQITFKYRTSLSCEHSRTIDLNSKGKKDRQTN